MVLRLDMGDGHPSPSCEAVHPEAFDYVITPEEGYEAIEVNPRVAQEEDDTLTSNATSNNTSGLDSVSEGGETADTVSSYGQSEGETASDMDGDVDDMHYNPNDSLRFPDPIARQKDATPSGLNESGFLDLGKASYILAQPAEAEKEDDLSAVRDSELTIKGASDDTAPEESRKESLMEEPEPETQSPARAETPDNSNFCKHDCRSTRKNLSKSLWVHYLLLGTGVLYWLCVMTGLVVKNELYQVFTGVSPADPAVELATRHSALDRILLAGGFVACNGTAIMARDVLTYPNVSIDTIGNSRIAFPRDISATVVDNDMVFVSLPKDTSGVKYLSRPVVRVLDGKCNMTHQENCQVSILKQADLVEGLSFISLNASASLVNYRLYLAAGQHVTIVQMETRHSSLDKSNNIIGSSLSMSDKAFKGLERVLNALIPAKNEKVLASDLSVSRILTNATAISTTVRNSARGMTAQLQSVLNASSEMTRSLAGKLKFKPAWPVVKELHVASAGLLPDLGQLIHETSQRIGKTVVARMTTFQAGVNGIFSRAQHNAIGIGRRIGKAFAPVGEVEASGKLEGDGGEVLSNIGNNEAATV